jgi:tetratricopeptide (TPR) repeat protein
MGKTLKAAQNFEIVDRLGGSTEDSLNNLGDIYANEGLDDLAVGAYLRALEADPEGRPDRAIRACRFLCSRGCFEDARRLIRGIERIHGEELRKEDRKKLLKLRARLAVAAGAGEEEARVLEQIIGIDPLDGDALILLGRHSARKGDVEKAIFYFERAAGVEGFAADAKVRHAQLLVKQGKYKEALPLLRSAQKLEPRENVRKYLEQVERVAGRGK